MEGTCLCKAVAVKVNDDNLFGDQRRGHICHCKNCRKVAGGIFGTNLIIENEKVEFPNGKDAIKQYDYDKLPTPEWESFASQRQTWEQCMPGTVQYAIKSFGDRMPNSPEKAGPAKN
ncbi:hypothetical protein LTS08_000607 [Lithohypha guttulata]|uniref:CENP-V/GFA domain-containing protein n=1 Tax=Lithohypha guttulata TaxID=1690604 RepID=A0AAN7Y8W2_9EURO|nr:hypothetical protein LTR05_003214 [Lithohypha guttulata]KAK5106488.1 hypothetical protein LTS08_000607 [Lithohypha guttulata]